MNPGRPVDRLLDANSNRLAEGLRTIEDYVRFLADDAELSSQLKSIRHESAAVLNLLDDGGFTSARNAGEDVGTSVQTPAEYRRQSHVDVVRAAASRCQQSMRVIEEFSKTLNVQAAQRIEQIRYRFYDVAAAAILLADRSYRRSQMDDANLCVLIDCMADESTFIRRITALCDGGVDLIQLRDKQQTDRVILQRSVAAMDIVRSTSVRFIVNDRADLALAADADGVHVGQDELPVEVARQILGCEKIVGLSTHNLDEVRQAIQADVDYIGCGPTFAGKTKHFDTYSGVEFLAEARQLLDQECPALPAFAIGGVNLDNVSEVLATGFHRVAVTAAVSGETASESAKRFKTILLDNHQR